MIQIKLVCTKNELLELQDKIGRDIESLPILFIDSEYDKVKARRLKSHWGTKLNPFAVVSNGNKTIKVFYSEAGNIMNDLIKYINEQLS